MYGLRITPQSDSQPAYVPVRQGESGSSGVVARSLFGGTTRWSHIHVEDFSSRVLVSVAREKIPSTSWAPHLFGKTRTMEEQSNVPHCLS